MINQIYYVLKASDGSLLREGSGSRGIDPVLLFTHEIHAIRYRDNLRYREGFDKNSLTVVRIKVKIDEDD